MKLFAIILTTSFWNIASAQITGAGIERYIKEYEIFEFNSNKLYDHATRNANDFFEYDFYLSEEYQWKMELYDSRIFSDNYILRIGDGTPQKITDIENLPISLRGRALDNNDVTSTITVNNGFLYGFISTRSGRIYFEPLSTFKADAKKDQYIIYHETAVVPLSGDFCAAKELETKSNELKLKFENTQESSYRNGGCLQVDLAVANDRYVYDNRGSGIANFNAGVIANVNTDYDNFNDVIQFVISETYISTSNAQDAWGQANDLSTLLSNFRSWGPDGFNGVHDLGELWSAKDYSGSTIGVAYIGAVCGFARYHVLKDINGSASTMRNLVSHEIGHNFNAGHDSGGTFIMSPSVTGSTTWSSGSISTINTYYPSLNCLSDCGGSPPPPPGNAPVAEFGATLLQECNPTRVQFLDQSTNSPTAWNWQFQSGSPSSSSFQNPIVEFPGGGEYRVTLTASNANGSDTKIKIMTLNVGTSSTPTAGFTYTVSGNTVTFSNTSTNATGYTWNFGDGTASTSTNPSKTYASPGTYTVSLTATNSCGQDIETKTITISEELNAGFSASSVNICQGSSVQFTNTSTGNITSYFWEFEGGTPATSTAQNPSVTYNGNGIFNVKLTVSNSSGSDFINANNFITVIAAPSASFNYTQTDFTVSFDNNTVGGNSYLWTFGNGASSSAANPTYTYSQPGTYLVRLVATNSCGNDDFELYVEIGNPLIASFEGNTSANCTGSSINFFDTSIGDITSYFWEFEGGTPATSTAANPQVQYNIPGNFDVKLTITDASGKQDFSLRTNYVKMYNSPEADFNYNIDGYKVTFTNLGDGSNTFSWTFGNGASSSFTNPSHTYSEPGIYEVKLTESNPCGSSSVTKFLDIKGPLYANFALNKDFVCAGNAISFSNKSTGDVVSYFWEFEGGTPSTSTSENPVITYNSNGEFDVKLTVQDSDGGTDVALVANLITVSEYPQADFGFTQDVLTFSFQNNSSFYNAVSWNFGDGNTSNQLNPTHTYSTEGNYTVSLTVENECGTDQKTFSIAAFDQLLANFRANDTDVCIDEEVALEDLSSGNPSEWLWEIKGSQNIVAEIQNPVVQLNSPGTYSVMLTVRNDQDENTLEKTEYISVLASPLASFAVNQDAYTAFFTNASELGQDFLWSFGDGNNSNQLNPTHVFEEEGIYEVTLTTFNQCGSNTITKEVKVEAPIELDIQVNKTETCPETTVNFSEVSSKNVVAWSWEFPGGNPSVSTAKNPQVKYATPGVYPVKLKGQSIFNEKVIEYTDFIAVMDTPVAAFEFEIKKDTVTFFNNSDEASSFKWFFGNEGQSQAVSPQFIFQNETTYEIILLAENVCATDTIKKTIDLTNPNTFAAFNIMDASYCIGDVIDFVDLSSQDITEWTWEFPGGVPSSSKEKNPKIKYDQFGNFYVSLTVSNGFSVRTIVFENYISIVDKPTAAFDYTIDGNKIKTTNLSQNATELIWKSGDGKQFKGISFEHTFSKNGNFKVELQARNSCGTDNVSEEVVIDVYPVAGFSMDIAEGCAPLLVNFLNRSSANANEIKWILEGIEPVIINEENPIAEYTSPGFYDVAIVATNSYGSDTTRIADFIEVWETPEADFDYQANNTIITFDPEINSFDSLKWEFGDGNISYAVNPIHEFEEEGIYNVTLTVFLGECSTIIENEVAVFSTSTYDIDEDSVFNLFPNPAVDFLNIELGEETFINSIEVTDMLGQRVKLKSINSTLILTTLNVSDLVSGTYFITIYPKDKIGITRKFLVFN